MSAVWSHTVKLSSALTRQGWPRWVHLNHTYHRNGHPITANIQAEWKRSYRNELTNQKFTQIEIRFSWENNKMWNPQLLWFPTSFTGSNTTSDRVNNHTSPGPVIRPFVLGGVICRQLSLCISMQISLYFFRADSRFALSQWEAVLLCNDVAHWLGASLESALF